VPFVSVAVNCTIELARVLYVPVMAQLVIDTQDNDDGEIISVERAFAGAAIGVYADHVPSVVVDANNVGVPLSSMNRPTETQPDPVMQSTADAILPPISGAGDTTRFAAVHVPLISRAEIPIQS
jgi:hypothetical protein